MTPPGDPTLRDLALFALGMGYADPDDRKWFLETFELADLPADGVVRRLLLAMKGGRPRAEILMEAWGEPIVGGERAKEAMKRLLVRAASAHAIEDERLRRKADLMGIGSVGERARIHAECDARERERFQKLADAEKALRPKTKEEAKV